MRAFATWITGHRKTVIVGWIVALIVIGGISGSVGADFSEEFKLPASDSTEAFELLETKFPAQSGDTVADRLQGRRRGRIAGGEAEDGSRLRRNRRIRPRQRSRQPLRRRRRRGDLRRRQDRLRDDPVRRRRQQAEQGPDPKDHRDRPGRRRRRARSRSSAATRSRKPNRKKATPRSRSACWRRSSSCCSPSARWSRWGCRSSPRCSRSASGSAWSRSAPTSSTPPTSRRCWRR